MTETSPLATIDFLTHSKVTIAADASEIWPLIVDVERWRTGQQLKPIGGEPDRVGGRFHAVMPDTPEAPLFEVENVEMVAGQRRTIRLTGLDGAFIGFATWELTPAGRTTVVAYDVYCRGAMLPPGHSQAELLASAQRAMDAGLERLKAVVEAQSAPAA